MIARFRYEAGVSASFSSSFEDFHPFPTFWAPGIGSRLSLHTGGSQHGVGMGAQNEGSAVRQIWVQIPYPSLI